MTTNIIRTAVLLVLMVTLAAAAADAQSRQLAKVDIPFSFQLNERTFDAGEYLIERAAPTADNLIVIVRNKSGDSLGMIRMLPAGTRGKIADSTPSLVFRRYGDTHVLSEIHAPAEGFFGKLRKTGKEIQLKRIYGDPVLARIEAK